LKSAETSVLLTKKYRSIKPNTQQLKKSLDKTPRKEDEEFSKKEINLMETDIPIVDTSEIGNRYLSLSFFRLSLSYLELL